MGFVVQGLTFQFKVSGILLQDATHSRILDGQAPTYGAGIIRGDNERDGRNDGPLHADAMRAGAKEKIVLGFHAVLRSGVVRSRFGAGFSYGTTEDSVFTA